MQLSENGARFIASFEGTFLTRYNDPVLTRLAKRTTVADSGCWEWNGYRDPNGYGRVNVDRRAVLVHRVGYEAVKGPIPQGLELDHLCRNPACWNVSHLEAVTHAENMARAPVIQERKARTHCPAGHAYGDANTVVRRGRRSCRQCEREILRRSKARRAGNCLTCGKKVSRPSVTQCRDCYVRRGGPLARKWKVLS